MARPARSVIEAHTPFGPGPFEPKAGVVFRLQASGKQVRVIANGVAGQKRQPFPFDGETQLLDDGGVLFDLRVLYRLPTIKHLPNKIREVSRLQEFIPNSVCERNSSESVLKEFSVRISLIPDVVFARKPDGPRLYNFAFHKRLLVETREIHWIKLK